MIHRRKNDHISFVISESLEKDDKICLKNLGSRKTSQIFCDSYYKKSIQLVIGISFLFWIITWLAETIDITFAIEVYYNIVWHEMIAIYH